MRWKWMTIGIAAACLAFAPAAHAQSDPVAFTAGPSGPTSNRSPSFEFTAAFPTDCRLITPAEPDPVFASCTSPQQLNALPDGDYQLVVAPSDTHDPALSATRSFTVDTVAPTVQITSAPTSPTKQSPIPVEFTSPDQGVTFECTHTAPGGPPETAACTSPWTTNVSVDGDHVFSVVAIDPAGNRSTPDTRTIRVDTLAPAAPTITSPAENAVLGASFALAGTFAADVTSVRISDNDVDQGPATLGIDGTWKLDLAGLPDGTHVLTAVATDAAGNASPPATRTVRVDTVAPAAVVPSQADTSTFTFASAESGATFQCRLEGPAADTGFVACTSPASYPNLKPGDYRFTLRTLDAAANHADAAPTAFSIAAAPEATPTPVPDITPAPTPAPLPVEVAPPTPTPQAGETVVVRASSGTILVRRPGKIEFVAISRSSAIPLGSEVDARRGRVVLTAEPVDGKPVERATFYAGLFVVGQSAGYVDLTLSEALAPCKKRAAADKPRLRKLWGDGKGKFRVKGSNSTVTVRGAKWLVQDSCDGTLTRVTQGLVSVRDAPKRKTVLLRAGRSYLAKPKK